MEAWKRLLRVHRKEFHRVKVEYIYIYMVVPI